MCLSSFGVSLLFFYVSASLLAFLGIAAFDGSLTEEKASYAPAQAIPISCLNRTIDTGEHVRKSQSCNTYLPSRRDTYWIQITDSQGELQYIPFPICKETNRPLELYFGIEKDINCTIPEITDSFFHLLQFYIHNDAPLTCRIPTHPSAGTLPLPPSASATQDDYIPLVFALAGTLQTSHFHISPRLNVLLHTSPELVAEDADIVAATAYSVPSLASHSTRIIIGDPLALQLSVRWYSSPKLPPSTAKASRGLGGHVHLSTVVYCLFSAGFGVAASFAYFRGVELPKRIRRYGKDRLGGGGGERGYAFPGNGASSMNGYGLGITGKRD